MTPAFRLCDDYVRQWAALDPVMASEAGLRVLRAQFGLTSVIRDSVDLLPRDTQDDWPDVAARLAAIPRMLRSWRAGLEAGLSQGLPAARRQAIEAAAQAERYAAHAIRRAPVHARALALGPIGLAGMAGMLRFDMEES